jgi:tetratricopeptide (TPR) repeat protein
MAKQTTGALTEAVDYFQQAIELDPDFALAYVGLADSYHMQTTYSGLPYDEMLPKVEAAINKTLEIDDQLGEVYATLGVFHRKKRDYAAAEIASKRALELSPNYATAHHWYAILLDRVGRQEEALVRIRRAQELDPLSATINAYVGGMLRKLGRFDEALAQYKKVIEIDPAFPGAYRSVGGIYWDSGQLDEAAAWYRKAIALDPGNVPGLALLGLIYLDLGDDREAEFWIKRSLQLGPESFWTNQAMAFLSWYRGQEAEALEYVRKRPAIYQTGSIQLILLRDFDLQAGRYAEARARYGKSYPELLIEDEPTIHQTNFRKAIDLAHVLTKTGEQERANMLLARALTYIQTIPRLGRRGYRIADVRIYALQGQTAEAFAALREAIDAGWRFRWWYYLEHDLNLESIRDEPEFQALVAEIRADMAEQLARLQEREATGELAPIPKSLE